MLSIARVRLESSHHDDCRGRHSGGRLHATQKYVRRVGKFVVRVVLGSRGEEQVVAGEHSHSHAKSTCM